MDFLSQSDLGFMALGVRGVSLLGSSGDGGVSGSQSGACPGGIFIPTWPASSLYVTAVGATQNASPETAASFSGGGFSNVYGVPDYQQAAVAAYLAQATLPPPGVYNHTGAGIPDVSALGVNFEIVSGGRTFNVDGTSCSCPTFAGIVSLLNDARALAGKPKLGFLNPLLYSHPEVFTDILTGDNPGCGSKGFSAAPAWDPITGLGSPVFTKMTQLAQSV